MTVDGDRLMELETELRDRALNVRRAALDELATVPSERALPILQRLADEGDFALRRLAVMGFGNHTTEASFQMLQQMLREETDANVVAEAANSIFEFGEVAIPILQEVFDRNNHWLVRHTILSLITEYDCPELLLEIAVRAIADSDNVMLQEAGILSLAQLADSPQQQAAFEQLEKLATSPFWRTRWRTAIALKTFKTPAAQQLINQLKQDEHYRVVAAALDSELS